MDWSIFFVVTFVILGIGLLAVPRIGFPPDPSKDMVKRPLPNVVDVQQAMRWWRSLPKEKRDEMRLNLRLISANDITRYWKEKHDPQRSDGG